MEVQGESTLDLKAEIQSSQICQALQLIVL